MADYFDLMAVKLVESGKAQEYLNRLLEKGDAASITAYGKLKLAINQLKAARKEDYEEFLNQINDRYNKLKEEADVVKEVTEVSKDTYKDMDIYYLDKLKDRVAEELDIERQKLDDIEEINKVTIDELANAWTQLYKNLKEKQKEEDEEAERGKELRVAATEEAGNIISGINENISQGVLARTNAEYDIKRDILKDNLDKQLIDEEEYQNEVKKLERERRIELAKEKKEAAIYQSGIDTIVSVGKTLAELGLNPIGFAAAQQALILGGLRTAAIAAIPVPKFHEGEIDIDPNKPMNKKGEFMAKLIKNESVINAKGTKNAPEALGLINKGKLSDTDIMTALAFMQVGSIQKNNDYSDITKRIDKTNNLLSRFKNISDNGKTMIDLNGNITKFV